MRYVPLIIAGLCLLLAGCAVTPRPEPRPAPAREPVAPEPAFVRQSAECSALWANPHSSPRLKFDPVPYGWAHARFDVEGGIVVKVRVLESSPAGRFDADIMALIKGTRFSSQASAQGCAWNHSWD